MENNKVITKNNKINGKNGNLFELNGNKLYFYIDSSVDRSEYRRLDTLIEKNGGINSDDHCHNAINLTSQQTIYHPKKKIKNYKFYRSQFIYDSVEKNCLQRLKNYRVPVFLEPDNWMMNKPSSSVDEDDTITSSVTSINNQDVNEKSISIINKKNNTKSKETLVKQPVDSDDDELSDIAVDQVSSTQSSRISEYFSDCSISNDSLESTSINKTELDLDEHSSSKPQAHLVINPFYKKKNIKKKDDDSKPINNTSNIEEKKSKAKNYPPEKLDCHQDNTQYDGAVTQQNDDSGGSKVNEIQVKELNETLESMDLLNPKNNRNKKSFLISESSESSDDEFDSIDNKKNAKDNIDNGDTPEDKFCDSINEMSIEENSSSVCSTKKLSQIKPENNTPKQAITDEDQSVCSDSQDEHEKSKVSLKKKKLIAKKKLNYQLSSDEENNEYIKTRKKIDYHKNTKDKILIKKNAASADKNPILLCLSPKKSNQINCQDSNDQSSPKCTQQKKETNKYLDKPQRMIGNCVARIVDLPSSSEDDDDSTPTKRARYSIKRKTKQSDNKSSSSSDNDNNSTKSNSSSRESFNKKSTSNCGHSSSKPDDNDTEPNDNLTSQQLLKIQHNQKVAKDLNIQKKSTKKDEAWMDGTKLCFSTDSLEKRQLPKGERRKEFLKWEQNEMIRFVYDHDKFRHSRSESFWKHLCATDLFSHRTPSSLLTHWRRTILTPEYIENSGLPKFIRDKFLHDPEYRKLKAIQQG